MMWSVVFDKWNEQWIVAEFNREETGFFWYTDALAAAAAKNQRLRQQATSSRSDYTEYDTDEPDELWPGGLVSYGSSRG